MYPSPNVTELTCREMPHVGLLMSFGVDLLLIGMCTLYAFKTRNLPENFNEAKFIGFTMYTTCVIWIAFVVLHLSTEKMVLSVNWRMSMYCGVVRPRRVHSIRYAAYCYRCSAVCLRGVSLCVGHNLQSGY